MEDCLFNGLIELPGVDYVGGIAGCIYSKGEGVMRDCVNYASVTGENHVGGVFGIVQRAVPEVRPSSTPVEIRWCVNKGEVTGSTYVGGVMGRALCDDANAGLHDDSTLAIKLNTCMNTGKVTGTGASSNSATGVGGVLGFSSCRTGVVSCANHGDVYANGAFRGVGGVAGSMGSDPTGAGLFNTFRNVMLAECCNTGTVDTGNASSQVGGVLGYQEEGNKSDVQDCYNTGNVKPKQNQDTGGIVGCVDHLTNIYRCVNSGKVEHGNAAIGTHKNGSLFDHGSLYFLEDSGKDWPKATKISKTDFTDKSKFKGLDFEKVWTMTASGPELRSCQWQDRSRFVK